MIVPAYKVTFLGHSFTGGGRSYQKGFKDLKPLNHADIVFYKSQPRIFKLEDTTMSVPDPEKPKEKKLPCPFAPLGLDEPTIAALKENDIENIDGLLEKVEQLDGESMAEQLCNLPGIAEARAAKISEALANYTPGNQEGDQ